MEMAACDRLVAFREALYRCFGRRRDALFELVDGVLTAGVAGTHGSAASVARLSLAPGHARGWGSAYAALRRGEVDGDALRTLLARYLAPDGGADGGADDFAVDVSVWPRRDAATSPERSFCYFPGGSRRLPVIEGWAYQWVARLGVLGAPRSSWTAPVDVHRVRPDEAPVRAAVAQIRALSASRARAASGAPGVPLFTFDAGYDPTSLSVALADVPVGVLVRVRRHRCFYLGGSRGLRGRGAAKFSCADPSTWPAPTRTLRCVDPAYGRVDVRAWAGLRALVRRAPRPEYRGRGRGVGGPTRGPRQIATGTVLRVQVQRLPRRASRRAPKPLWLWWHGPGCAAPSAESLDRCWRAYARRFDLEQTFRFMKQRLGWTAPRVRLPEQADRWTWLVLAAFAHLLLARTAVADRRLPWERPLPAHRLTPTRVLRAFVALAHRLPRVSATPRPCGTSPGRPRGRRSRPAPRYPPVSKAA